MKKLFLLLIPLLFTACSFEDKRGDFIIVNGTSEDLTIILSSKSESYGPTSLYSRLECNNCQIDRDYTLKVKYRKSTDDRWTTFIFHPVYKSMHYYVTNNGADFIMFSDTVNGKSEDIKRVLPE